MARSAALPAPRDQAAPAPIPREALAAGVLLALAALSPFLLGWLSVAPNRLVSPRPVPLPLTPSVWAAVAVFLLSALGGAVLARRAALLPWAEALVALAVLAMLTATGLGAAAALSDASSVARAAPASGVWLGLLLSALAAGCCAAGRGGTPGRFLLGLGLGLALLVGSGALDALSLLREAASRGAELRGALVEHVFIAAASLLLAALVAIPLSVLALRRPRLEAALMGLANGLQVVPSIALFGLLMAPLTALAAAFPVLRGLGIGGIGPAPAVLAIGGYLLLPLAAGMLSGLRAVPAPVMDAAIGQGLGPSQILWRVRLPLGGGIVLGGLRTAVIQAIGLATLAALIGGGGLGRLVFLGVGQLATDLILLGVLPVVALSLAADAGLAALQTWLSRRHGGPA
ncbi:ABC transporter permease subunit [Roseomonas gilardii subsp. gilardii]|uniref:ABC transporter permease subunit n=1 Tax=Roseomonas gilardii TaxID=257708 RepID=UPI001FFA05B1|nr:ABC transporter permease subunit [Roseomonas gilardii]UPG71026.1 ABC transporter permease subunit [Roseomonas gilardii subsp. gilardii]